MENTDHAILFVDDDASLRTVVSIALEKDGHHVDTAADGEEAIKKFAARKYALVIQDIRMPGMNGLELLRRLIEINSSVPVMVMTAFSTWDIAVEAMRLGAFDYLKKPFDNHHLRLMARRAIEFSAAGAARDDDPAKVRMIGSSPRMKEIQDIINRVARNDSTVLVEGESGTGKELVAAMLHTLSHRQKGPLIAVNCGGFSETLLESELFGHIKGSFTGAVADKRGLLELADGGTFLLDEIGETTLSTQVRLLRVLETKTFIPVGGETPKKTDVRFIASTNRNLLSMAEAGTFRQDLYYRLNVIPIRVPALRERREDLPLLAGFFLSLYANKFNRRITGYDKGAMEAILSYDWPGNIRELQNAAQRAVSLAKGDFITFADIFPAWTSLPSAKEKTAADFHASAAEGSATRSRYSIGSGFELEKVLDGIEAGYLREALERSGNNLTQAAELLGITFRSIRYRVKKLGLVLD
ncbi:MAG: sigma-54 dependent transcriptional regulator [Planctomycetes bacterium]|nr:sigma-54 dependent transcriptional regulator [Planctomycetota bacterium]